MTSVETAGRAGAGTFDPLQAYARVSVADDGPGIEPATLARIFEPFFTTKPRGEGSGLGLAVVHGTVLSLRGVYAVESRVGSGTEFVIYLPILESGEMAIALDGRAAHSLN